LPKRSHLSRIRREIRQQLTGDYPTTVALV
jgi:hypothetical protein